MFKLLEYRHIEKKKTAILRKEEHLNNKHWSYSNFASFTSYRDDECTDLKVDLLMVKHMIGDKGSNFV